MYDDSRIDIIGQNGSTGAHYMSDAMTDAKYENCEEECLGDDCIGNLIPDPIDPPHYNRFSIQPIDFIRENNLGYLEGNVIKYICRAPYKNGLEDYRKAKQYLEWLIEDWSNK